ncbi:MAG: N-methyl-L-tryptophan oxidase, partial [Anaerolineales bacterium]|nr:N-methyl-L-tryptophan oxidase [Anaerolineales bacterium]
GSQDHSRIIRLSYHTPTYVELAKRAYAAWAAVEADAAEPLIIKTGGLDLFPAEAAIASEDYTNSMDTCGVPYEWLNAAEVMARWPQFRLTDDVRAIYQTETGIAPAAKCNAAHIRLAQAHGATLRERVHITAVHDEGGEITVATDEGTYHAQKLIIAAGAWSNHTLAHFGVQLPLTVTQEQVSYYATPHLAQFAPDRFPVWIWMDDPCYYGFPVYGEAGTKTAQDVGGHEVTAESRTFDPDLLREAKQQAFLQQVLPDSLGPVILTKTCLYTMPPDRDFVVDTLPEHPNVAVGIGAGHAFKYASVLGQTLAELVLDGETPADVRPFQIDRPILLEENPLKQFLV